MAGQTWELADEPASGEEAAWETVDEDDEEWAAVHYEGVSVGSD